jgi:hypothetical protein
LTGQLFFLVPALPSVFFLGLDHHAAFVWIHWAEFSPDFWIMVVDLSLIQGVGACSKKRWPGMESAFSWLGI